MKKYKLNLYLLRIDKIFQLNAFTFFKNGLSSNDNILLSCSICGHQARNHTEHYHHQLTHIMETQINNEQQISTLCNSLLMNANDNQLNNPLIPSMLVFFFFYQRS